MWTVRNEDESADANVVTVDVVNGIVSVFRRTTSLLGLRNELKILTGTSHKHNRSVYSENN